MACKKLCPECGALIPKRKVLDTAYKLNHKGIICQKCNTNIEPKWGKVGGWMALFILPAGPFFNIFDTSTVFGVVTAITVCILVLLPLAMVVGICKVPLVING